MSSTEGFVGKTFQPQRGCVFVRTSRNDATALRLETISRAILERPESKRLGRLMCGRLRLSGRPCKLLGLRPRLGGVAPISFPAYRKAAGLPHIKRRSRSLRLFRLPIAWAIAGCCAIPCAREIWN